MVRDHETTLRRTLNPDPQHLCKGYEEGPLEETLNLLILENPYLYLISPAKCLSEGPLLCKDEGELETQEALSSVEAPRGSKRTSQKPGMGDCSRSLRLSSKPESLNPKP